MFKTTLLATLALLVPTAAATERLSGRYYVSSTAYCLNGTMANGRQVHVGAVASNMHPLGTRIKLARPIRIAGKRRSYFRVEDRIGYGTQLDFWMPSCGSAISYGRVRRAYRVIR